MSRPSKQYALPYSEWDRKVPIYLLFTKYSIKSRKQVFESYLCIRNFFWVTNTSKWTVLEVFLNLLLTMNMFYSQSCFHYGISERIENKVAFDK